MSGTLCTKSYGLIRFSAGKPSLPPLRARYPTLYSKFSCTNSAKDNWHPLHRLNALRHFHNSTLHTISPCNAQECWQTKVNLRTPRAAFRRPMGSNLISTRLFSTPATEGETADLVKWIEAGGGRCESMRIATDSVNGQTLVADRRIREGKQVTPPPPRLAPAGGTVHRAKNTALLAIPPQFPRRMCHCNCPVGPFCCMLPRAC